MAIQSCRSSLLQINPKRVIHNNILFRLANIFSYFVLLVFQRKMRGEGESKLIRKNPSCRIWSINCELFYENSITFYTSVFARCVAVTVNVCHGNGVYENEDEYDVRTTEKPKKKNGGQVNSWTLNSRWRKLKHFLWWMEMTWIMITLNIWPLHINFQSIFRRPGELHNNCIFVGSIRATQLI